MLSESKTIQKKAKVKVSHQVKDYGNNPFFVKKAKASKEFLEKRGFPIEVLLKKQKIL